MSADTGRLSGGLAVRTSPRTANADGLSAVRVGSGRWLLGGSAACGAGPSATTRASVLPGRAGVVRSAKDAFGAALFLIGIGSRLAALFQIIGSQQLEQVVN